MSSANLRPKQRGLKRGTRAMPPSLMENVENRDKQVVENSADHSASNSSKGTKRSVSSRGRAAWEEIGLGMPTKSPPPPDNPPPPLTPEAETESEKRSAGGAYLEAVRKVEDATEMDTLEAFMDDSKQLETLNASGGSFGDEMPAPRGTVPAPAPSPRLVSGPVRGTAGMVAALVEDLRDTAALVERVLVRERSARAVAEEACKRVSDSTRAVAAAHARARMCVSVLRVVGTLAHSSGLLDSDRSLRESVARASNLAESEAVRLRAREAVVWSFRRQKREEEGEEEEKKKEVGLGFGLGSFSEHVEAFGKGLEEVKDTSFEQVMGTGSALGDAAAVAVASEVLSSDTRAARAAANGADVDETAVALVRLAELRNADQRWDEVIATLAKCGLLNVRRASKEICGNGGAQLVHRAQTDLVPPRCAAEKGFRDLLAQVSQAIDAQNDILAQRIQAWKDAKDHADPIAATQAALVAARASHAITHSLHSSPTKSSTNRPNTPPSDHPVQTRSRSTSPRRQSSPEPTLQSSFVPARRSNPKKQQRPKKKRLERSVLVEDDKDIEASNTKKHPSESTIPTKKHPSESTISTKKHPSESTIPTKPTQHPPRAASRPRTLQSAPRSSSPSPEHTTGVERWTKAHAERAKEMRQVRARLEQETSRRLPKKRQPRGPTPTAASKHAWGTAPSNAEKAKVLRAKYDSGQLSKQDYIAKLQDLASSQQEAMNRLTRARSASPTRQFSRRMGRPPVSGGRGRSKTGRQRAVGREGDGSDRKERRKRFSGSASEIPKVGSLQAPVSSSRTSSRANSVVSATDRLPASIPARGFFSRVAPSRTALDDAIRNLESPASSSRSPSPKRDDNPPLQFSDQVASTEKHSFQFSDQVASSSSPKKHSFQLSDQVASSSSPKKHSFQLSDQVASSSSPKKQTLTFLTAVAAPEDMPRKRRRTPPRPPIITSRMQEQEPEDDVQSPIEPQLQRQDANQSPQPPIDDNDEMDETDAFVQQMRSESPVSHTTAFNVLRSSPSFADTSVPAPLRASDEARREREKRVDDALQRAFAALDRHIKPS